MRMYAREIGHKVMKIFSYQQILQKKIVSISKERCFF